MPGGNVSICILLGNKNILALLGGDWGVGCFTATTNWFKPDTSDKKMKSFLLTLFLFLIHYGFAFAGDALSPIEQKQFLQEMKAELDGVKNFWAEFEQQRHLSIMMEPLISKGVCTFEVPDKLRWEISTPYSSILIYNAEKVAKFEIDQGQLKKLNFGAAEIMRRVLQQIISWIQGDFSASQSIYSIQIYKGVVYKLQLIPKSELMRENLKVIELHIEPKAFQIKQVLIKESAEDFIKIIFKNKQENSTLPKNTFHTKQPCINK